MLVIWLHRSNALLFCFLELGISPLSTPPLEHMLPPISLEIGEDFVQILILFSGLIVPFHVILFSCSFQGQCVGGGCCCWWQHTSPCPGALPGSRDASQTGPGGCGRVPPLAATLASLLGPRSISSRCKGEPSTVGRAPSLGIWTSALLRQQSSSHSGRAWCGSPHRVAAVRS